MARSHWTFVTFHALVLLEVVHDPDVPLRRVAVRLGLSERAVQRILDDLVVAGYVDKVRNGRTNHYAAHLDRPLRHPLVHTARVGALVEELLPHVPTDGRQASRDSTVA